MTKRKVRAAPKPADHKKPDSPLEGQNQLEGVEDLAPNSPQSGESRSMKSSDSPQPLIMIMNQTGHNLHLVNDKLAPGQVGQCSRAMADLLISKEMASEVQGA